MPVTVIIGEQRGDEGKGRFVDMQAEQHDIVARFNGGPNAGHTVVLPDGRDLALHLVPSGIAHPGVMNVIGNGTMVDPVKLVREIADITSKGIAVSARNLMLSSGSHLILPHHISDDEIREAGSGGQGSTKAGIAQVAASKSLRMGVRADCITSNPSALHSIVYEGLVAQRGQRKAVGLNPIDEAKVADEYVACAAQLTGYITDTVLYLNEKLRAARPARVLAEGAQAFLLDIDHGMYPFVTSTSTTSGGVSPGLGIPPYFIDNVIGIVKAMPSHVGGGPFVTEELDPGVLARLHGDKSTIDAEVGTTTGRIRRLGHLDLVQIRRSQMVNGTRVMALSKLDWVSRYGDEILICVGYKQKNKSLEVAPDAADKLEQCTPAYKRLPGWTEDIQGVREFSKLPQNAQKYIEFIESQTGIPITMIGVGPNRDQVIIRPLPS